MIWTLVLENWRTVGVLVLVAALGGYGSVMRLERDHARNELEAEKVAFAKFKTEVKAAGDAQNARAKAIAAHDELLKEEADNDHEVALAGLRADIARLRRERDDSRSGELPPAPSGSSRPDLFCVERAEYQREDGELAARLRAGARGLADEGTEATVNLDSAKRWAQSGR